MTPFLNCKILKARNRTTGTLLRVLLPCVLVSLALAACGSDDSNTPSSNVAAQCGSQQTVDEATGTCTCPTGTIVSGKECTPCGANEVVSGGACVCAEGYERATASDPCTSQGASSSFVKDNGSAGGPPGSSCAATADCAGNDFCDLTVTPSVCKATASGQGTPCTTDADCAGFEANYCESWVSQTCLVRDCKPDLNNCSDDYICCNFDSYGLPNLCVARALNGDTCK